VCVCFTRAVFSLRCVEATRLPIKLAYGPLHPSLRCVEATRLLIEVGRPATLSKTRLLVLWASARLVVAPGSVEAALLGTRAAALRAQVESLLSVRGAFPRSFQWRHERLSVDRPLLAIDRQLVPTCKPLIAEQHPCLVYSAGVLRRPHSSLRIIITKT